MTATPTMLALVQEYLAFRRTLGFALGTAGQELLLFARYADRTGHRGPVTTELAVRWAQLPTQATPAYWAWRLQAVRLFAQHQAVEDPRTEVPPPGLLGPTFRRAQPHIYSTDEVAALLRAARTLRRRTRPHTCLALFGLLHRQCMPAHLDQGDPGSEPVESLGQLQTDGARAQHHHVELRHQASP